ncbi:MAG: PTS sugar transporter subunit IIA, partial [Lachnospiraceae bacterium]|nr:PTS sugar transporter subunit IIA [Lachnospiraceae bacterium]
IAPSIALPHARPEQGVVKSQIAITLFRNEVRFEKEDSTAQLFVALAAADSNSHLNALMTISEILQDEEKVERILQSQDIESLYSFFE